MTEELLSQAVNKLRARSYSKAEMREYLLSLGANHAEAETVSERLLELTYLDDNRLAQEMYNSYRRAKPCGHLLWSEKLKQRGIDEEIIEQLTVGSSEEDEYSKAEELAAKFLKAKANRSRTQQLRGLAALLERRGFTSDTIELVLREQQEGY